MTAKRRFYASQSSIATLLPSLCVAEQHGQ
jgi:hypothetical protein